MVTEQQARENRKRVQEEAVVVWENSNNTGCLELATGAGKTKIGLTCLERITEYFRSTKQREPNCLIAVPTEGMRDVEWPNEAELWGISLENCTIVCYATLGKVDFSKFDFMIFDECHRLTLPPLKKLQARILADPLFPYVGLTATLPRPNDFTEDFERISMMLNLMPSVYKLTTDEAVELGLIADFEIKVLKFDLDSTNLNILGGTKLKPFKQTEAGRYAYLTTNLKRATIMAKSDPSKMGFKFSAIQKRTAFMYDLPSKLRLASLCLEELRKLGRVVVFAGSIPQCDALCGIDVFHSQSNEDALDRFQKGDSNVIGSVKALNEGRNLLKPDAGLVVQVDSVDRNLIQRIGRLVRVRYDNMSFKATIVILVAANTADDKWFKESISGFDSKRITMNLVKVPPIK